MSKRKHPWKICPVGEFYIRTHPKTINGKEYTWKGNFKKEILTTAEIQAIADRFKNEKLKMLKLSSFIINLFFIISITSCSQINKRNKEIDYIYPPDNPFPSIFTVRKYKDQNIGLTAKLNPETIKMSCRLRNDSPYYWCDFEGELISPDPKLPKKIASTFHVVVAKEGKKVAINFAKRMKKYDEPVVLVLEKGAFISKEHNLIYSQLFGVYNSKECFDVFHDYSLCPKSAKKLNIFTGDYID